MLSLRTPQRIPQIVAGYLRAAGESAKHLFEFSQPSERWSETQRKDFGWLAHRGGSRWLPGIMAPGAGNQLMSVLPPNTVFMPDFSSFQAELKNYNEVVRYALYSFVAYPVAGSLDLSFFQDSQAIGRDNTNMETAGQLPGNQMQVVVGIRLKFLPAYTDVVAGTVSAAQVYRALTNHCWIEGYVSNKLYTLVAPADFFPAGNGLGTVQGGANFSLGNNGLPTQDAIFRQDPPLGILPTRPFNYHYRSTVLNTVSTEARLGMYLDGFQLRAVL